MKMYKHSTGQILFYPEHIPKGWEVMLNPNTFESVWRRIRGRQ